jgi:hypothetical protein
VVVSTVTLMIVRRVLDVLGLYLPNIASGLVGALSRRGIDLGLLSPCPPWSSSLVTTR